MAKHSCTSWAGQMGKHKHRVFSSLLQSLLSSTGLLEENVLPLMQYWLSSTVNKVLDIGQLLFLCEMKFSVELSSCCHQSSTHSFSQSCEHSLVSELKYKSCAKQQIKIDDLPEERASGQIRIEWHSNFKGGAQKLGNNVLLLSGMILNGLQVCSSICRKWNATCPTTG